MLLPAQHFSWCALHISKACSGQLVVLIARYVCVLSCFSYVRLFSTLWTVASQAPLSMGFSRQDYWSGLSFSPPGDLPNPGIKPVSFMSPALSSRFFTTSATWEAQLKGVWLFFSPTLFAQHPHLRSLLRRSPRVEWQPWVLPQPRPSPTSWFVFLVYECSHDCH